MYLRNVSRAKIYKNQNVLSTLHKKLPLLHNYYILSYCCIIYPIYLHVVLIYSKKTIPSERLFKSNLPEKIFSFPFIVSKVFIYL